jgi:adenylate cyclase
VGDQISGRESNPALIEGNRMRGSTPGASSQEQIPDPGDEAALTAAISITEPLLPPLEQTQRYVWRRHLFAASEQLFGRLTQPADGAPMVVGLADITGFTGLSRGLDQPRLAEFIETFEAATAAVITAHGARVIKTLGDEVMFAAASPNSAVEIGLELSEWTNELDGRPALHVGMARGPVLHRLDDG